MQEYIFTLKFKLPNNANTDELVNKLYAQNCDDALIGTGVLGQIALEFAREANSAEEAITSALQDVLNTLPNALLIEATPDYVGLTDIAEIVSVSRQQMRKLYEQSPCFPAPVHTGKSALWNLAMVLDWIKTNKTYAVSNEVYEVAKINALLNAQQRLKQVRKKQMPSYAAPATIKHYSISVNTYFTASSSESFSVEVA